MNSSGPKLLFMGHFKIINSISLLAVGLFRFSISSGASFNSFFLGIFSFHLSYLICWHTIHCSVFT